MAFVVNPATQEKDILRIVEYPYRGASPTTLLDLNDGIEYSLVSGTFKVTPPERKQQFSESGRRYGGNRLSKETHGNGAISAEWYIRGVDQDETNQLTETLLSYFENVHTRAQRYIAWQPAGASRPVLYEIRAPAPWDVMYRWIVYKQTRTMHIQAGVQVAPLAEGLPMFVTDRFEVDSIADWRVDVGTPANISAVGGMHATTGFGTSYDIIHKDRAYLYGDHEQTAKITIGSTPTATRAGVTLKVKDSQHKIRVYWRQTGALATLVIATVVGGTETAQNTTNLPALFAAGDVIYVRGWIEKNRIYSAIWNPGNSPEAEPDTAGAHTLSTANQAYFGFQQYGEGGLYLLPQDAGTIVTEYKTRPFHYKGGGTTISQTVPASIPLDGDIPGSAPAKTDIDVILTAASAPAPFALFSWVPEFSPFNLVWNGDFEDDVDSWSVAAPAGSLHVAGTSITRITTQKYRGLASAEIVLPATLNAGAHHKIYRTFMRGVPYTLKMRVRAASGTPSFSVGVGYDTANFAGSGTQTAGSAWTEYTATWTPTADTTEAFVYIRSEAASAMTLQIDAVQLYIGTTAPTTRAQTDGRGGFPPFGIIKAMSRDASRSTGWTTPAETATYIHNNSFVSGALEFLIDPTLIPEDHYTSGETGVEVWAVMSVNNTDVVVTPRAIPGNLSTPAAWRAPNEFSSKLVPAIGSSGTDFRTIRLGTLNLKPIHGDSGRWRLRLGFRNISAGTANLKVQEIYLTPIKNRALTPTGKPLDSFYPVFLNATTGLKRVNSDLRGEATALPSAGMFPDSGLGGSFIELDPGQNRLFVKLSDKIPDDSTGSPPETNPINARLYVDVTPRYYLARD